MKTKIALIVASLVAIGCSDGVLRTESPNPSGGAAVPPNVILFDANPLTVDQGSSTTLSWEVEGADKVEIVSTATENKFSYATDKDFTSTTVVDNLQETTTFILTATKNPGTAVEGEAAEGEGAEGGEIVPAG